MSGVTATAAVKTRLAGVVSTSKVFDMLANPTSEVDFKNRFVDENAIHAYEVTREGTTAVDTAAQAATRSQQIVIYGYASAKNDGSTEAAFQAEVDAIVEEFDRLDGRRYGGLFDFSSPLAVDGPKYAMKGNYLVHFVRMVTVLEEFPIN